MPFEFIGPATLADLYHEVPLREAESGVADAMGDRGLSLVREFSPVDSGRLRDSWYKEPTSRTMTFVGAAYESKVSSDLSYAADVEYGTGLWGPSHSKYEILPKNAQALSWIAREPFRLASGKMIEAGTRVYARRVMHPGSRGQHMMARSATGVEAGLDLIARPVLEQWVHEQEALAEAPLA